MDLKAAVRKAYDAGERRDREARERFAGDGHEVVVGVEEVILELRGARAVVDAHLAVGIWLRRDLHVVDGDEQALVLLGRARARGAQLPRRD